MELRTVTQDLVEEIRSLKERRNAVILAHNYQLPEVQDVADFLGDSLGLSQEAARTDAEVILFCGVHFMAETASILSPTKKVLIPDLEAGCSLSSTITAEQLRVWKRKYPEALVVTYVNTSAEVKAESDYCCTSANAVKVVRSIPNSKEIIFVPDMFLGSYVENVTGRKMHVWPGECHVHAGIRAEDVASMREKLSGAQFLIHPECGCVSSLMYSVGVGDIPNNGTRILSTEGIMKYARESKSNDFVIATENGILHRLQKENPSKRFHPVKEDAYCRYMKMITLDKVRRSLEKMVYEVRVPEPIASKARISIERMLQLA
jgi:quinolinate synthase